jgi:hypothetical protein
MAGKMRKEWTRAKDGAQLLFKTATGKAQLNALAKGEAPPAWPFKFDKDLGPTLDKFEDAKKPDDRKKYGEQARKVIALYQAAVKKEAGALDKLDKDITKVLAITLNDIASDLPK